MKSIRVEVLGLFVGATLALGLVTAANSAGPGQREHSKYSFALQRANGSSMVVGNWDSSKLPKATSDQILVLKGGQMYRITDKLMLKQAAEIFAPMTKLGDEQSALGDRQSKLGDQQGRLGDKQSGLGDEMSKISEGLGESADDARKRAEAKMAKLSKEMEALGKQQEALSHRQESLGREQEALGRKQEAAAKVAEAKVTKLIDSAFARGLAKAI